MPTDAEHKEPTPEETQVARASLLNEIAEIKKQEDFLIELRNNPVNLKKTREVFHKWHKYEDETLLDLCLAVGIHSRYLKTRWFTPLWLMIISASGQRKSRTVEAFLEAQNTYLMNYITPNTFVSGWKKQSKNDLCNKLKEEDIKLIITGDMSQFIKMFYEAKGAVWSQLREGYYGRFQKKTGSGVDICYEGILFDWLACSTYVIDEDLIMKDQLGSRELCLRIPDENDDPIERDKLMLKVWDNSDSQQQQKEELKNVVNEYFKWWEQNREELAKVIISDDIRDEIFQLAYFITQLRATAECDPDSGDLLNFVYPESPTRILEQLKMLFICLKQIDFNYPDETALLRLFEITKSSIHPVRLKILKALYEYPEGLSTTKISHKIRLRYAVTKRELNICLQLNVVDSHQEVGQGGESFIWTLNEDNDIFKLLPDLDKDLVRRVKPTVQTQILPIKQNDSAQTVGLSGLTIEETKEHQILKLMSGLEPKSAEEILKQFPELSRDGLAELLEKLVSEGKLQKTPDGKYVIVR